jgi:hypothetical protein
MPSLAPRLPANSHQILAATLGAWHAATVFAQNDSFAGFIRKSDQPAPDEEQQCFHLLAGFKIQSLTSEPEISKLPNLAFDDIGCLWLTQLTQSRS